MFRELFSLAVIAMFVQLVLGANFTVGGSNGWDTTTDLQSWVRTQSFSTGDNLIFQYTPPHDVLEVTKADYDSCQSSNPLQVFMGGTTVIPLSSPGKRYFICGISGHCTQGMKLQVDTLATSVPPSASFVDHPSTSLAPETSISESPVFAPSGSPSGSPSPSGSIPLPSPSSANGGLLQLKLTIGFGFGMMILVL